MKKILVIGVAVIAVLGALFYAGWFSRDPAQAANGEATGGPEGRGRGGARGAVAGGRGGRGAAGPMTVETATAARGSVAQQLVVVGNLIGDATVSVVPRATGRLEAIYVRLGDPVSRGQRIAKIEDFELQEQVKQQEAALEVSRATIRQREADLRLAETSAERSRNLYARQLLPKQTLDDTEARYQAAVAQLDLARAQNTQSMARLDELRINLANTVVVSPVNGFVARRGVDPGAFVGAECPYRRCRRHQPRPAGRQHRRKGFEADSDGRHDAGRSRCVPRRDVQWPDRASRTGARSGDPDGADRS